MTAESPYGEDVYEVRAVFHVRCNSHEEVDHLIAHWFDHESVIGGNYKIEWIGAADGV